MEYLFFGPYWFLCAIRATFSYAFQEPIFGRFKDWTGIGFGLAGTILWVVLFLVTFSFISGLTARLRGEDELQG
jgi:hypothetical protein